MERRSSEPSETTAWTGQPEKSADVTRQKSIINKDNEADGVSNLSVETRLAENVAASGRKRLGVGLRRGAICCFLKRD